MRVHQMLMMIKPYTTDSGEVSAFTQHMPVLCAISASISCEILSLKFRWSCNSI